MKLPILAALILAPAVALAQPAPKAPNAEAIGFARTASVESNALAQCNIEAAKVEIAAHQQIAALKAQIAKLTAKPAPKPDPHGN